MNKVKIKPLSANNAWQGRRYKTEDYKVYERDLGFLLPKIDVPTGRLQVKYTFGLSNKGADGDNCIKQFQDIISKKYGFNDNKIYHWDVWKVDVKKGEEYIEFEIKLLWKHFIKIKSRNTNYYETRKEMFNAPTRICYTDTSILYFVWQRMYSRRNWHLSIKMKSLIFLILVLPFLSNTFFYNAERYKVSQFIENGCVWDECPDKFIAEMVEEHHGSYPPSHYKRGTKEWLRSYFNYQT